MPLAWVEKRNSVHLIAYVLIRHCFSYRGLLWATGKDFIAHALELATTGWAKFRVEKTRLVRTELQFLVGTARCLDTWLTF